VKEQEEEEAKWEEQKKKKKEELVVSKKEFIVALILGYGSHSRIPISSGSTDLGRGSIFEIDDKKCSRKQGEIVVNNQNQEVALIAHGVNPSFLKRKGKEPEQMEKGKKYILKNGDSFTLLLQNYKTNINQIIILWSYI